MIIIGKRKTLNTKNGSTGRLVLCFIFDKMFWMINAEMGKSLSK